jgi:hypothetical protein
MITNVSCTAAIVAGLMIAGLAAAASRAATDAAEAPATADASHMEPAGAAPARPQESPPVPTWRTRPIFVCGHAVPVIFSDRPCGASAEARVLRVHDPGPGRAASIARAPTRETATRRPEPRAPEPKQVEPDERCRKLRDERERLDDRMRAGYTAREAARLWNRWREVGAQIYAARC